MLLVMIRYILILSIFRLILLILELSGLLNAHEGPLGTGDHHFSVCMCSPGCYLSIPSHLGLNDLDLSGFNKIRHDIALFEVHFANFGTFCPLKANEGPLGTPNPYFLLCMCSPSYYFIHSMP
jgi:hypothetical protein